MEVWTKNTPLSALKCHQEAACPVSHQIMMMIPSLDFNEPPSEFVFQFVFVFEFVFTLCPPIPDIYVGVIPMCFSVRNISYDDFKTFQRV